MITPARQVLMLCLLAWPVIGEELPPAPPLGPAPIVTPQLPGSNNDAKVDPKMLARRRLAEMSAEHTRQIAEIDAALGHGTPAAVPLQEGLDLERHERNAALMLARSAAQDFVAKSRADTRDQLAVPAAVAPSTQNDAIASANRLEAADCYRQLILDKHATDADLGAGAEALSRIDAGQLPPSDLPRLLYLRVWFASEQARHCKVPAERARFVSAATDAQQGLQRDFPASELNRTGQQLIRELETQESP